MNNHKTILIVDDELNARNRLMDLLGDLQDFLPTKVIGEAKNGIEALEFLESNSVDLVLCDIAMPEMDGLEFARHAKYLTNAPHIIFVTAYDDFAIKAFEVNAIDYLLKPVRSQRLHDAIKKLENLTEKANLTDDFPTKPRRFFSCIEMGKIDLVPVYKVIYIRADDKYVEVVTDQREFLINETLSGIEKEFPNIFIRAHRSFLVSKKNILGIVQNKSAHSDTPYKIELEGCSKLIPISRRQWSVIKKFIKSISSNQDAI